MLVNWHCCSLFYVYRPLYGWSKSRSFYLYYGFMPDPTCLNQNLKEEAANAVEHLQEAESEAKALRSMTQRMILTQEEMVCPSNLLRFMSS